MWPCATTAAASTPDILPYIFDLFTQAERTPDRSQGGLGIGLALVKSLVALHGGTVRAASDGLGRAANSASACRAWRAPDARRRRGLGAGVQAPGALRVMVVDDNLDAAQMLAALLEVQGHAVCVEYDGKGALARAARTSGRAAARHRPARHGRLRTGAPPAQPARERRRDPGGPDRLRPEPGPQGSRAGGLRPPPGQAGRPGPGQRGAGRGGATGPEGAERANYPASFPYGKPHPPQSYKRASRAADADAPCSQTGSRCASPARCSPCR
jgi:hypothetical protein